MKPLFAAIVSMLLLTGFSAQSEDHPNFVVIFTDDQGYGDLSCFGGKHVHTPRIDQMAKEGAKLTSFYVAAPVCTPSRAALMTGCYPTRIDMATGSKFGVLLSGDPKGLNPKEVTIAEVLKSVGYKTAIYGKCTWATSLSSCQRAKGSTSSSASHIATTSIRSTRGKVTSNSHLWPCSKTKRSPKWIPTQIT